MESHYLIKTCACLADPKLACQQIEGLLPIKEPKLHSDLAREADEEADEIYLFAQIA